MKNKLTVYVETHKQTDWTRLLDKIENALLDCTTNGSGDINGYEIRDYQRRLRGDRL